MWFVCRTMEHKNASLCFMHRDAAAGKQAATVADTSFVSYGYVHGVCTRSSFSHLALPPGPRSYRKHLNNFDLFMVSFTARCTLREYFVDIILHSRHQAGIFVRFGVLAIQTLGRRRWLNFTISHHLSGPTTTTATTTLKVEVLAPQPEES